MHMRDNSCHANVARATDYNQSIGGTYLAHTAQRGRAMSCKPAQPCACHSAIEECMPIYARRTLRHLTTCMHSLSAYIICVTEAKMAVHRPPTPPSGVTAKGVDSAGLIGRAQTRIDFRVRMGDGWAYLEAHTPRSQSSEKDLLSAPVTVRISMVSDTP